MLKQTIALSADQKKAIAKLKKLRVGALFMEPGTGKTRTALELIKSSAADYVLFMVPYRTKQNLLDEINKCGGLDQPYEIAGIQSISASDRLYSHLINRLRAAKKPFMVVDEGLLIKNDNAIRTERITELGKLCYYRLILNGTPISKNILDLWAQMEFLSPKILNMPLEVFKNKFLEYSVSTSPTSTREKIIATHNVDYLYSLIEPYVFEAKLKLDINNNEHEASYYIVDKDSYNNTKHSLLSSIFGMNGIEFLAVTQKMQQSYSLDQGHIDKLQSLLKKIKGKTIIFVKYVRTQAELAARFPQCLVLTYGKGSLGLNLQEYTNIVFYDKTWDYAQIEQAKRRIFRYGQKHNVNYYMMTGDVGLEQLINNNVKRKNHLLDVFKKASDKEKLELVNEL